MSKLTGREYKLLLDPRTFTGAPSDAMADAFWTQSLCPIVRDSLDARNAGKSRAKGALTLKKKRIVRFYETKKRLLSKHGFALRSRVFVQDGEPAGVPEVTLKFRTPDVLLAAEFADKARSFKFKKAKFEEDIAPLQIGPGNGAGKKVTATKSHAPYSRFSVSLYLEFDDPLLTLGDAFGRFRPFERELEDAKQDKVEKDKKLHAGPTVCEWVFQNATVDLGEGLDAEFGLTLWYFVKGGTARDVCEGAASGAIDPQIAEISFALDIDSGRVDSAVSRRGLTLFTAMQEALPVDRSATSKTELALPPLR